MLPSSSVACPRTLSSSGWATSRGYAREELHTPQKRAGAREHRIERLLDLLDGALILIVPRKTAGRAPSQSRHARERRRRGELRRQGRLEKFFERDVEIVSGRCAPLSGRPTGAAFQTSLAQVVRELIDNDLRV